ncbi:E3 ubiquitin-protein ligase RGLG1-like isoform X1 [Triticum dicoccoides]|uniref:E3 ubiquitin-protein ligase RGLG1-like isoform X1 n=1 Tax=Triticum dicoccoides TaxID=85692 RepID=UPI00162D2739|nr:E3 ubiquitin-protein ligase RGLG1-like isoform X1 [Triticum dicoccoides]
MILSAFLLLCCAVATWTVSPAKGRQSQIESPSSEDHLAYGTLDQVKADLQRVGLESSNLIIGVDFTRSNEWTGKRCFGGRSLHHLGAVPNPYEEAISIVGETLSAYDEDNDIPCFGFGDMSTHDQGVFGFYGDVRPCAGIPEALLRYREITATVQLSGPTSLAPIIEAAMGVVQRSGHQYHILLIIADGQVPRGCGAHRASSLDESRSENDMEERTLQALIHASHFPLSIVLVGVGDGPWDDDQMPFHDGRRRFDNFQFVDFTKIMSTEMSRAEKEERFALEALEKIPSQYAAIVSQRISDLAAMAPARRPLPPPS